MEKLFRVYQRELVEFANSRAGRYFLKLRNLPVVKVTPNSVHYLKSLKPLLIQADFYTFDRYGEKLFPNLESLDILRKYRPSFSYRNSLLWAPVFAPLTTSTFTASTGEGRVVDSQDGSGKTFATVRGEATGTSTDGFCLPFVGPGATNSYVIERLFDPFDTSSIGAGQTVSSWFWKGYRDDTINAFSNVDTTTIELIPQSQASNTVLAVGDYGSVTFTSKGSLALASTTNNAYNTVNGTDNSFIVLTGFTKVGVIIGRDLNNTAPTGNNSVAFQTRTGANPPTLSVTYAPPAAKGGNFGFFEV